MSKLEAQVLSWDYFIYKGSYGGITDLRPTADSGFMVFGWGDSVANLDTYPAYCWRFIYYFDKQKNIYRKRYFRIPDNFCENNQVNGNSNPSSSHTSPEPLTNGHYLYTLTTFLNIVIAEADSLGSKLWEKNYGGSGTERTYTYINTSDKGKLLGVGTNSNDGDIGFHYGSGLYEDIFLLKLDSNYNKEWGVLIGGSKEDRINAIYEYHKKYYIAGFTASTDGDFVYTGTSQQRVFLICLDSVGNQLWKKEFEEASEVGHNTNNNTQLYIDSEGIRFTCLSTMGDDFHGGGEDIALIKTDTNGNLIYRKNFGGSGCGESIMKCVYNPIKKYFLLSSYFNCSNPDGDIAGFPANKFNHMWVFCVSDDSGKIIKNYLSQFNGANIDGLYFAKYHPYNNNTYIGGATWSTDGIYSDQIQDSIKGFLFEFGDTPLSINDIIQKNTSIEVYPNPSYDKLNIISHSHFAVNREILLTDIIGTQIQKQVWRNDLKTTVDISSFAKGIYTLYITENNTTIFTSKIIKQ